MTTAPRTAAQPKVLLVDDDVISLEVLSLMLDHDGYQVLRAPDGEAALHLLRGVLSGDSPDVLLVDMQMPGVSGSELAEKVRAMQGPEPLLLAMSATAVTNQQLQGFDGFLLKPLALDDLRNALERKTASRKPPSRLKSLSAPGNNSRTEDSVDQAVLGKLKRAMPASSLTELYHACLSDTRSRLIALRDQVRAGEMAGVTRGAHQVKGAAAMVGASRIAKLASALEMGSCKEEDTPRLLDDLLAACDELERMLLAGNLLKPNDDSYS